MRPTTVTPSIRLLRRVGGLAARRRRLLELRAAPSSRTERRRRQRPPASAGVGRRRRRGLRRRRRHRTPSSARYLTGEDGKTLYIFTPDSANTSTCIDACATTWPPFTVESDDTLKAGDGVTGALTTFARPDGTMQVAINGLPLYYFANDTKAGDTTGQGVGGKWFVATPTGATAVPGRLARGVACRQRKGAY